MTEVDDILEDSKPEERTRAERRHTDFRKAIRKRKISKHWWWPSTGLQEWYRYLHMYSKGKIHCSCPMCRNKTNNKNSRYGDRFNWPMRDKRRLTEMKEQVNEDL